MPVCVCVCVCAHVSTLNSLYRQDFALYKYFNYYYEVGGVNVRGVSTPEQHYENLRVPQNELHDCQKLACQVSFSAMTSSQTRVCFV